MSSESEMMQRMRIIVNERGAPSVEKAKEEIRTLGRQKGSISVALAYFSDSILPRGTPFFPALLAMSCEAAAGKKTKRTTPIAAALILVAAAADIHDDIIDKSKKKYKKATVLGKFGRDIALLAGDTLLFAGITMLNREIEFLQNKKRETIRGMLSEAFFEVSNAEAQEAARARKCDITSNEYYELIKLRAAVPEVHCKIGAVLGNASKAELESLGRFGRNLGIAATIRDEIIDLMEYQEFRNRIRNEYPPLPLLYAFEDLDLSGSIKEMLRNSLSKKTALKISDLVLNSDLVETKLKKLLNSLTQESLKRVAFVKNKALAKELTLLFEATVTGL
jgi:geranylgeranyl pyrophosphate synthase